MLFSYNTYIKDFQTTIEKNTQEFKGIIQDDKRPHNEHPGRFNVSTSNESAILIIGQEFDTRDIVLDSRGGSLKIISEIDVIP